MERHQPAPDDFQLRRGGTGKLRVWKWREDPRITVRERINASDGVGYRVTIPKKVTGGRVIFLQSRDFDAAKAIARTKGGEFRESRATALILSDDRRLQAASGVRVLRDHSVELGMDEVVREYCRALSLLKVHGLGVAEGAQILAAVLEKAKRTGKPIQQVVDYAVGRLCPEGGVKTLKELTVELIEMKRGWLARGDLRDASFRDFDDRAGRIGDELGSFPLPALTKQILFDWLSGLKLAARTKKNYRMVLAEILRYAEQKRYIASNPLEEFTRQDIKEIEGAAGEHRQPAILSLKQAADLLDAAFARPDLDLGAAVVLGLFGGIRTEELKRLTWDAVRSDEEHPFVVIGPEIAKKRRIRNVPLPACAIAWLRLWTRVEKVTRNAHTNDYQKRFKKLCGEAKISWDSNAMRHSFGSYHYARYGNSIETARILGHKSDDTVLFSHYRALTSKVEGEAYFNIFPKPEVGVIVFPHSKAAADGK